MALEFFLKICQSSIHKITFLAESVSMQCPHKFFPSRAPPSSAKKK